MIQQKKRLLPEENKRLKFFMLAQRAFEINNGCYFYLTNTIWRTQRPKIWN